MPRHRKLGRPPLNYSKPAKQRRGRKAIFTPAQKRVLEQLIRLVLKKQLRAIARVP